MGKIKVELFVNSEKNKSVEIDDEWVYDDLVKLFKKYKIQSVFLNGVYINDAYKDPKSMTQIKLKDFISSIYKINIITND